MTIRRRTAIGFALGITLLGAPIAAVRSQAPAAPQTPARQMKPIKDWPDAETLAKQKKEAESRRLFRDVAPLEFTLTADFKAVNKDRNPTSTKTFPATIEFTTNKGKPVSAALQIRGRGHSRRALQTCDFVPLRLEFTKETVRGTVFDGHGGLKLGTHCRQSASFEQFVLREYAAYRILNLLTPRSFRARLAKATYVDAVTQKPLATRYAMFIEDDDDMAKRMEGRITERLVALTKVDRDFFTLMAVFEYLIGNTDVSIISQHNIRLVESQDGTVYTVPYDFDYAGLIDAPYAIPAKALGLASVRERMYRGPCRPRPELQRFFEQIVAIRSNLAALYDDVPDLDPSYKKNALGYLDQFYKTIERPGRVDAEFKDNCVKWLM